MYTRTQSHTHMHRRWAMIESCGVHAPERHTWEDSLLMLMQHRYACVSVYVCMHACMYACVCVYVYQSRMGRLIAHAYAT